MDSFIVIMEEVVAGHLTGVAHDSANSLLVGESRRWGARVFVKVFPPDKSDKWRTETAITRQLTDRWLLSAWVAGRPVMVLRDGTPTDLGTVTPALATAIGRCIANFHQATHPFLGIRRVQLTVPVVGRAIAQIRNPDRRKRLRNLWRAFDRLGTGIDGGAPDTWVVCHGDVGVRNLKIIDGRLQLIDFERGKVGPPTLDFVKLFYQDFQRRPALQAACLRGYVAVRPLPEFSPLALAWQVFVTAVGIMQYLDRIADAPFLRCANAMLADVTTWVEDPEQSYPPLKK